MFRLLLLLAAVAWVLWRLGLWRGRPRPPVAQRPAPAPPANMIACSHCGLHLPEADAVSGAEGRRFCSEAHRLAGPR
jgi:uncharacterized protein